MGTPNYVRPIEIALKGHPEFNEKWVQKRIAEDPSILGLGELYLKSSEVPQPTGGRLDLLLEEPESRRRYEVEIQLGKTDESHIIRTIEYWDIERKRHSQVDHCAVLVAEGITSRFLNVISLFNGIMPLVAIQLRAIQIDNSVTLLFTTVLDERRLGAEEDESEVQAPTDRNFWETVRGTKETVALADRLLQAIHQFAPGMKLKFNKEYIGLAKGDLVNNFVSFRAKREFLTVEFRLDRTEELDREIKASGVDAMTYDSQWSRYRVRVTTDDLARNEEFLKSLMERAWKRTQ